MFNDTLMTEWTEAKVLFELIEKDFAKNSNGNIAAGVRVRKGLRELRRLLATLGKNALENDRAQVESKKKNKSKT